MCFRTYLSVLIGRQDPGTSIRICKSQFLPTFKSDLKELYHDILSSFGSLKIVVNWKETFK